MFFTITRVMLIVTLLLGCKKKAERSQSKDIKIADAPHHYVVYRKDDATVAVRFCKKLLGVGDRNCPEDQDEHTFPYDNYYKMLQGLTQLPDLPIEQESVDKLRKEAEKIKVDLTSGTLEGEQLAEAEELIAFYEKLGHSIPEAQFFLDHIEAGTDTETYRYRDNVKRILRLSLNSGYIKVYERKKGYEWHDTSYQGWYFGEGNYAFARRLCDTLGAKLPGTGELAISTYLIKRGGVFPTYNVSNTGKKRAPEDWRSALWKADGKIYVDNGEKYQSHSPYYGFDVLESDPEKERSIICIEEPKVGSKKE